MERGDLLGLCLRERELRSRKEEVEHEVRAGHEPDAEREPSTVTIVLPRLRTSSARR